MNLLETVVADAIKVARAALAKEGLGVPEAVAELTVQVVVGLWKPVLTVNAGRLIVDDEVKP